MMPRMLVIDDEEAHARATAECLERVGCDCEIATSGSEGLAKAAKGDFAIVFTDLVMPDMSGMEVMEKLKARDNAVEVVVITGKGTVETAVEAMQKGAATYIQKPLNIHELRAVAERLVEKISLRRQVADLQSVAEDRFGFQGIIGASPALQRVFGVMEQVVSTDVTVLVYGETGTGKELVARALHFSGRRSKRPFVVLNCAALSESLIESELFGHVRGSFTGAVADRTGRIEYADRGTLFLDEVADMPASTQVKLLRVLEQGELSPIGSNKNVRVDVRVIAATHRRLDREVEKGRFRADLYYRLKVVTIELPPLRERREDIPLLTAAFAKEVGDRHGRPNLTVAPEVCDALAAYDWPGNIRELKNVVENMVITARGDVIGPNDIPANVRSTAPEAAIVPLPAGGVPQTMEQAEIGAIRNALAVTKGNREEAARILGIGERTLYRKIKKYGL